MPLETRYPKQIERGCRQRQDLPQAAAAVVRWIQTFTKQIRRFERAQRRNAMGIHSQKTWGLRGSLREQFINF